MSGLSEQEILSLAQTLAAIPLELPGGETQRTALFQVMLNKALREKPAPKAVASGPLPQWQSHKVVEADQIIGLVGAGDAGAGKFALVLACGLNVEVTTSYRQRVPENTDIVGGYYVRYEDGYESWSPAKAFQDGYARLAVV